MRRLLAAGIPVGEVNDLTGVLEHPQLKARKRWMSIKTRGGLAPTVRAPFSAVQANQQTPAVPGLGEHTDSVLAELAHDERRDVVAGLGIASRR